MLRVRKRCRQILDDDEYGQRALEWVWRSCYYALVSRIRSSVSVLSEHQKQWSDRTMRMLTAELAHLAAQHPTRASLLSVYIGDLHRYSFLFFTSERDRGLAILHYQQAVAMDEKSGLALNQIGLMKQDADPLAALLYFMLAHLAEQPFHGAYANILALLTRVSSQLSEDEHVIPLLTHCFASFRALEFQEYRLKWFDQMHTDLGSHEGKRVAMQVHILALASATLVTKDGKEEARAISAMLLDASTAILQTVEELAATVAAMLMAKGRRRRQASDSSKSPESEGWEERRVGSDREFGRWACGRSSDAEMETEDVIELSDEEMGDEDKRTDKCNNELHEAKTLLTALVHFAVLTVKQLYAEKTPAAVRFSFEHFSQRLTDMLNSLMLGESSDKAEQNLCCVEHVNMPIWYLSTDDAQLLLPTLVRRLVDTAEMPISFDTFFRYAPISSSKDLVMKNMAKLRLACRAKQEEARSLLPVYVVPEDEVVLERLSMLRDLVNDRRMRVVIAEDTLRMLDKIKKGDVRAREAIRWLQKGICEQGDRLEMRKADSVAQCAEEIVNKSRANNQLIVAILTMDILGEQYDEKRM
ncbi:unnamed protein product [Toxocara canis]|uniref:EST1_DNA_bind domain-containing protein n=1 Tax=Toxocara canis TaxID=6265 RepID=A0A183TX88_TOXCA|nr:unnamed protein product [Toxocara canis]